MRYVAAYLLAALGGNESPSSADIEKILSSVGIEADATLLKKVIADLKGKNLADLIEAGKTKLASMPSGGGVAASSGAAAGGAPAAAKEEKAGTYFSLCILLVGTMCDRRVLRLKKGFNDDHYLTIFRMNLH